MPEAITNTSPMLYLYRIGVLEWLPQLYNDIWIPQAVVEELQVASVMDMRFPFQKLTHVLEVVESRVVPSEWLSLDLGLGELAVLAIALDHPHRVVLLDDSRARRVAQAAGLVVGGTQRILLEAKSQGLTQRVAPYVDALQHAGMWMSEGIRQRILALASEGEGE